MKIIGLTGGIGSGKTTVSTMFKDFGIPIYIADIESKKLTNSSKIIRKEIIDVLGEKSYSNDKINNKYVAELIFNDVNLLKKINNIIHPKVAEHFNKWAIEQDAPYIIKEAAILYENDGYKNCDFTILITAPLDVRIDRVLKRNTITKGEILERIKNQWEDVKKEKLADYIIENIHLNDTLNKVKEIHLNLLKKQ
mgnify:CR=1 FL=1